MGVMNATSDSLVVGNSVYNTQKYVKYVTQCELRLQNLHILHPVITAYSSLLIVIHVTKRQVMAYVALNANGILPYNLI